MPGHMLHAGRALAPTLSNIRIRTAVCSENRAVDKQPPSSPHPLPKRKKRRTHERTPKKRLGRIPADRARQPTVHSSQDVSILRNPARPRNACFSPLFSPLDFCRFAIYTAHALPKPRLAC